MLSCGNLRGEESRVREGEAGRCCDFVCLKMACRRRTWTCPRRTCVGSDSVPIRREFSYANGEIVCRKRASGPAALTLMWESKNFGNLMLETTRLPEREEPYILNLELARGRVMRLMQKREEWGLFDIPEAATINEKALEARDLLLEAITAQQDPAKASEFGDKCLQLVLPVSEQAALAAWDLLLQRRIATRNFPHGAFGVRVEHAITSEAYRRALLPNADFVRMPMWWKLIEPQEQQYSWQAIDEWMEFLRARAASRGGRSTRALHRNCDPGMALHLGARLRDRSRPVV